MVRHALNAVAVCLILTGFARAQTATPDGYALGASCKPCHAAAWSSWEKTKHATAFRRVATERDNPAGCVGCHVTPQGAALREQDANANVQCEGCHGPGRDHIKAAESGAAKPGQITRKPAEEVCVQCHAARSPHFKFFSYAAMLPLSHAR